MASSQRREDNKTTAYFRNFCLPKYAYSLIYLKIISTISSAEILRQSKLSHVVWRRSHRHGWSGQLQFALIGVTFSFCGISFLSSVEPNITNVLTPRATAICSGAESEHKKIYALEISSASSLKFFVFPK